MVHSVENDAVCPSSCSHSFALTAQLPKLLHPATHSCECFLQRMFHHEGCPTRVSHKGVAQECLTRVPYKKSVTQECRRENEHSYRPDTCKVEVRCARKVLGAKLCYRCRVFPFQRLVREKHFNSPCSSFSLGSKCLATMLLGAVLAFSLGPCAGPARPGLSFKRAWSAFQFQSFKVAQLTQQLTKRNFSTRNLRELIAKAWLQEVLPRCHRPPFIPPTRHIEYPPKI